MGQNGKPRRLLVVSSGSWDASILGRNALGRLLATRLNGFFDEVDHVFFPAAAEGYHEPERGFRVHDIPGRVGATGGSDAEEEDESAQGGRARWGERLSGLREGWRSLQKIVGEHPPTVVNAVEPFISGMLAAHAARRWRRPLVATVVSNYRLSWKVGRMNPIPFLPAPLTFTVERWILARAQRIHADCEHYAEYAEARGARHPRIRRIPRYADPLFYFAEPDPGIWQELEVPGPAPLVYLGRLSPEKYAVELAWSFRALGESEPERRLVVLGGGGPEEARFLEIVRAGGLEDRVLFRRGLERDQIFSALGRAGAVLATHAGYALLEAALAGAAVVAYDYEWHPELIEHGRTGHLVPFRNAEAMAGAAKKLLRDPEAAKTMGLALRERARTSYRPEDHQKALQQSYEELLRGWDGPEAA